MSSRRPSKITRTSCQGDQLGRQNGAWNRSRLALLRRVLAPPPAQNPSLVVKNLPKNGKNIVKNVVAVAFLVGIDHIGRDHGQEKPRSPRRTFELASPPEEVHDWISRKNKNGTDVGFGVFLQNCAFCKKKFVESHFYMYGYLRAFCSPECGDYQIALDGFDKTI